MAEPMATAINNGAMPGAVSSDAKLYAEERAGVSLAGIANS
jgi:hypothetical protein